MFECEVSVALPMAYLSKPELSPVYFTIGTFNFDPGLQVGEEVQISDWQIGWKGGDKPFNGLASVVKRSKKVVPSSENAKPDIFRLSILLEIADKEDLSRVCSVFRSLNPGKFVEPETSTIES